MNQRFKICRKLMAGASAAVLLGMCVMLAAQAAPAEQRGPSAPAAGARQHLQVQLQDVDAKMADARARNTRLQAQVAQLEQQNTDRSKRLQERDDQIAALQKKLQAAGVPASAASAGH